MSLPQPILVLVGPSGVGKSTFLNRIIEDQAPLFVDIVTYTTRKPRDGEEEGESYHFISEENFRERMEKNFFVEWAQVHDRLYGTPRDQLEQVWEQGRIPIMDIDVQGAAEVKRQYAQAWTVFILPPDKDALRQRILKREGKLPSNFEERMKSAEIELSRADEFDYQLINGGYEEGYKKFKKLVEELVSKR